MNRAHHGRWIRLPAIMLILLGCCGISHGALIKLSLEAMTAKSRYVVRGQVIDMKSSWRDFEKLGRVIVTEVTIRVNEAWRGTPAKEITVQYFGGEVGEDLQVCLESPRYKLGEKVLVFVRERKGKLWTTGWLQGKFTLLDTESGVQIKGRKGLAIPSTQPLTAVKTIVRSIVTRLESSGGSTTGGSTVIQGSSKGSGDQTPAEKK